MLQRYKLVQKGKIYSKRQKRKSIYKSERLKKKIHRKQQRRWFIYIYKTIISHACLFFFNMRHALPVHPHSQNPIKIRRQIIKKFLKKNPNLKRCSLRDYNVLTFFSNHKNEEHACK